MGKSFEGRCQCQREGEGQGYRGCGEESLILGEGLATGGGENS